MTKEQPGQGFMPFFLTPYILDGVEKPILTKEDDIETQKLLGSNCIPVIRGINADEKYNLQYMPYIDTCLRNKTLKLCVEKSKTEQDYKDGLITQEEQMIFYETDMLERELLNIARVVKPNGTFTFGRLSGRNKKDRAITLMYGLAYVKEIEVEEVQNMRQLENANSWMGFARF